MTESTQVQGVADVAAANEAPSGSENVAAPAAEAAAPVEVQEPAFPQAVDSGVKGAPGQVDILLDTTVAVEVRLAEVNVQVRDLLQLTGGSVVRLEKQAGEPVDLYMRGIKFATGHLVIVGEQLGVRIKEILPAPK